MDGPAVRSEERSEEEREDLRRLHGRARRVGLGVIQPAPELSLLLAGERRHLAGIVGPLDEGYGMGFFEDDDYCRRVRETGKRVVCAEDVFVHHELSASFNKIDKKERDELFERSRRYFESKWGEWTPHVYRPQPPSASDSEAFVEDDGPTAVLNR